MGYTVYSEYSELAPFKAFGYEVCIGSYFKIKELVFDDGNVYSMLGDKPLRKVSFEVPVKEQPSYDDSTEEYIYKAATSVEPIKEPIKCLCDDLELGVLMSLPKVKITQYLFTGIKHDEVDDFVDQEHIYLVEYAGQNYMYFSSGGFRPTTRLNYYHFTSLESFKESYAENYTKIKLTKIHSRTYKNGK